MQSTCQLTIAFFNKYTSVSSMMNSPRKWVAFSGSHLGISLELNRLSFSDLPQAPLHHSPCFRKLPTKKAVVVVVPAVMVLAAQKGKIQLPLRMHETADGQQGGKGRKYFLCMVSQAARWFFVKGKTKRRPLVVIHTHFRSNLPNITVTNRAPPSVLGQINPDQMVRFPPHCSSR